MHNVPTKQVISEFESMSKPQVSSETQFKILPHRTIRGKPRNDYEPLFTSKPHYPMKKSFCETFMKQLSVIYILNSVQEALKYSK